MNYKNKSILKKLIMSVLIALIIPIFTIGISIYCIFQRTISNKVDKSIESTLEQVNINISNKLAGIKNTACYYATHKELKNLLEQEMSLENVLKVDEIMYNFMLGTNKGAEQVTIGGNSGQIFINWKSDGRIVVEDLARHIRQSKEYEKALTRSNREIWVTNMDSVNKYNNEKCISIIKIIHQYSHDEDNIGFVIASISEEDISELFKIGIKDNQMVGCIIDEYGKLIAHIDNSLLGEQLLDHEMNVKIKETNSGSFIGDVNGVKNVIFYERIPFTDWTTILTMPYQYYNKELRQIIVLMSCIIVASVILAISISIIFLRSIVKPVKALVVGMEAVSKGNLEYQVAVIENNEIGILANQFNKMTGQIKQLLEEKIQQENNQRKLEVLTKNAELKMLRAQINPHFLFNTLNSIKCLAIINNANQVAQMIGLLGKLLEASMGKGKDWITIREELGLLDSYIALQKLRYGDKITLDTKVEEALMEYVMPQFILQPVVENAIKHGLNNIKKNGHIAVYGYEEQGQMKFEIMDNGEGITKEVCEAMNQKTTGENEDGFNGIGIKNIDQRIKIIFGNEYGLQIQRTSDILGGTTVMINMPIVQKEEKISD